MPPRHSYKLAHLQQAASRRAFGQARGTGDGIMYPPIKREEEAATSCGSGPTSGPLFAIHHQWAGSNQQDIEMPSSDGTTDRSFTTKTNKEKQKKQTEQPRASNVA